MATYTVKVNFQGKPNKNLISSCSHWSCTSFVLTWCSLDKQVMLNLILIDVQYLQKVVFSFEKGSNHQNHCSSGSHYPVKNSPSKISDSLPHSITASWKTLTYGRKYRRCKTREAFLNLLSDLYGLYTGMDFKQK